MILRKEISILCEHFIVSKINYLTSQQCARTKQIEKGQLRKRNQTHQLQNVVEQTKSQINPNIEWHVHDEIVTYLNVLKNCIL